MQQEELSHYMELAACRRCVTGSSHQKAYGFRTAWSQNEQIECIIVKKTENIGIYSKH